MQPAVKITPKELSKPETSLNEPVGRLQLAPFSGVMCCMKTDEVSLSQKLKVSSAGLKEHFQLLYLTTI